MIERKGLFIAALLFLLSGLLCVYLSTLNMLVATGLENGETQDFFIAVSAQGTATALFALLSQITGILFLSRVLYAATKHVNMRVPTVAGQKHDPIWAFLFWIIPIYGIYKGPAMFSRVERVFLGKHRASFTAVGTFLVITTTLVSNFSGVIPDSQIETLQEVVNFNKLVASTGYLASGGIIIFAVMLLMVRNQIHLSTEEVRIYPISDEPSSTAARQQPEKSTQAAHKTSNFCSNCGIAVLAESRFCVNCGERVT